MNYEIFIDGKQLYYPNDETFVIFNSQLTLALNEAGSFEFDIPEYNLRYDEINPRQSMIQVLQNDTEIFYGEVREVTQNFNFTKHVYAVGELAFLFDSIQPQAVYQGTPRAMLEAMLNHHNAQVEQRKSFYLGQVSVDDDYVYHFTNREDTLTDIRSKMCDTLNCYIKVTKVNDKRYLNLVKLEDYGIVCRQEIQFGENLLNYSQNMSAQDIATCVIPLGKRLEESERTSRAVNGLDEYLTIVDTSTNQYHKTQKQDYVQIDSAVAQYGYVRVVKTWDDVTLPENLQKKGIEWLKSAQYEKMTLELSALDLNILDANIDSFDIGDTIHVWALPFGMDTSFPVRKKVIYINDLSKNTVSLGGEEQKSYTSQASNAIAKAMEEIPAISPILQSAKDNALAMLLDETQGGYVVFEYAEDSTGKAQHIEAISICNGKTIEQSTQRWRWNAGAFGYMSRKTVNEAWTNVGVAMTKDGRIVADFITAGLLKLAGDSNDKANKSYLEVYNGNTKIGEWTKAGLMAKASNYSYTGGDYSIQGMIIDMQNHLIRTPHFCLDANGNIHAKSGGDIGGFAIRDTYLSSNNKSSYNDNTSGVYLGTSGIGLGANVFTVDNNGKLTCSDADIKGKISATSGSIGTNASEGNRWQIGDHGLYKGCSSVTDVFNSGVYVGTDGLLSSNGKEYVRMYNGSLGTNTAIITTGNVNGLDVSAKQDVYAGRNVIATNEYQIFDSTSQSYLRGATGLISWVGKDGTAHALNVKNGIIVGIV